MHLQATLQICPPGTAAMDGAHAAPLHAGPRSGDGDSDGVEPCTLDVADVAEAAAAWASNKEVRRLLLVGRQ